MSALFIVYRVGFDSAGKKRFGLFFGFSRRKAYAIEVDSLLDFTQAI